jgi:hypothetical protein
MTNENRGLWYNIQQKRKRGEKMRKPGSKGAPTAADFRSAQNEEVPGTSTASIPNPADTVMGPSFKTMTVVDKRRRKDQHPVLLKRFRKYIEQNDG